jgi:hypothetical protein
MNTRTSNSQMNGRSWSATSQRVISSGMLALALAAALALNAIAPARVAHAAYMPAPGSSSGALVRTASYLPFGGSSGVASLALKARIAPAKGSGGCVSVVGTGSRAWRTQAAQYELCPF